MNKTPIQQCTVNDTSDEDSGKGKGLNYSTTNMVLVQSYCPRNGKKMMPDISSMCISYLTHTQQQQCHSKQKLQTQ